MTNQSKGQKRKHTCNMGHTESHQRLAMKTHRAWTSVTSIQITCDPGVCLCVIRDLLLLIVLALPILFKDPSVHTCALNPRIILLSLKCEEACVNRLTHPDRIVGSPRFPFCDRFPEATLRADPIFSQRRLEARLMEAGVPHIS